ncbi:DUF4340 domain-containing protein [Fulvivirga sedimenti]|uniref:DUF4340 domain-containing protein n=1 Tax=Fulvivirga sedimenti TaxID=2879465 RepID=A0A9X1HPK2_9BACT|nr:DUF4340 domain-containing protein [Fulvivirga sedimenti]MCA6073852.1 DUF4340 domain-containing protein [Fulvivirga sedimenti]
MMMQRKKNLRLLGLLLILVIAAVVLGLTGESGSKLDVDRDIFTYDDPSRIDAVVLERRNASDTLAFVNGQWMLNGKYKADPQRISVLFAILKQAMVRRKAARTQLDSLQSWMDENSVRANFYEGNELVKQFEVGGHEDRGITYYRSAPGEPVFLMEIPGYRSYLAGIYELDENGWRYPRVYDFNWRNLKDVHVEYPANSGNGFDISSKDGFYSIEQLAKTDTTKLTNFLDDLSLLYVNDFLFPSEAAQYDTLQYKLEAQITVRDVGDNRYLMEVLGTLPGKSEILIRIDSSQYALAQFDALRKILRPRKFFVEKETP